MTITSHVRRLNDAWSLDLTAQVSLLFNESSVELYTGLGAIWTHERPPQNGRRPAVRVVNGLVRGYSECRGCNANRSVEARKRRPPGRTYVRRRGR